MSELLPGVGDGLRQDIDAGHALGVEQVRGHVADAATDFEDPLAPVWPQRLRHPVVVSIDAGHSVKRPHAGALGPVLVRRFTLDA
jgi:hypothetical protein